MEIANNTPLEVVALPMEGPGATPVLTIVIKGTFDIRPGASAMVALEQIPIAYGDEFYDVMGTGSVKFESDIVLFKPRADIVLVGKACAPGGRPVQVMDVMLRVGHARKTIRVFGERQWRCVGRLLSEQPSAPKPFVTMDLVYERAFGGIDMEGGGYCAENLVGRGFVFKKSKKALDGVPLPNLEDPADLIKSCKDRPKPIGFGFYGKAWMPRLGYLEAHDKQENQQKEESFPEFPAHFGFDHENGAHPDLQVDGYLKGDEEVELLNLTPEGTIQFFLPGIRVACNVAKLHGPEVGVSEDLSGGEGGTAESREGAELHMEEVLLNLDTLCLIPDQKRLYLVWRGLCRIKDLDAAEVAMVRVA